MKNKNNSAFTLVELIVVLVILAILWAIAFMAMQWYSQNARDSARWSDLWVVSSNMDLFYLKSWFYPTPSNYIWVTYSWAVAWNQWTIWESVIKVLWWVSKKPSDPLTKWEYAYSVTSNRSEYQLWASYEWSVSVQHILNQAYAWNQNGFAKLQWNYNWQILQVRSGSTTYILAVPSIISWDINLIDVQTIITNKKLVYNGYSNLPYNYSGSTFDTKNTWFDFNPSNILVYNWSVDVLKISEPFRIKFLSDLQGAYSWTILAGNTNIKQVIDTPTNINTPSQATKDLAYWLVVNGLKIPQNQILWYTAGWWSGWWWSWTWWTCIFDTWKFDLCKF